MTILMSWVLTTLEIDAWLCFNGQVLLLSEGRAGIGRPEERRAKIVVRSCGQDVIEKCWSYHAPRIISPQMGFFFDVS